MRISRIFVPDSISVGLNFELNAETAHYVRTVLRLKKQQKIILFNGQGVEFYCSLLEISRKTVAVSVDKAFDRNIESPLEIILGLAISRGDRMDWAVQKAVELGVNCITPLITERCVVKIKDEKKQQRFQHWQNIIQHAAEQCGRTMVPKLTEIKSLQNWVIAQNHLKIFLDPTAEQSFRDVEPENMKVTLLSGPEGGFSAYEKKIALSADFNAVRLGQRILRTETASLAAISAAQMLWGDFGK